MNRQKKINYAKAVVAAACLIFSPLAAQSVCRIFEHRDYKGARYTLLNGDRMIMTKPPEIMTTTGGHNGERVLYEPSWNDALSSFRLTKGCTLTVWKHANPAREILFRTTRSYLYVGDRKNDEVSEALCTCP